MLPAIVRHEDRKCGVRKTALGRLLSEWTTVKTAEEAVSICDELRRLACEPAREVGAYREGVKPCLELMTCFSEDCAVQKSGLLALAVLCEKQKLSALIGKTNGVRVVLDAWHWFHFDEHLVKNAIVTMRSLSDIEGNRAEFCMLGGVQLLTNTMRTFTLRTSIQIAAAALIANLCFESDPRRQELAASGVVGLLLEDLTRTSASARTESSSSRLQTNACLALRNLSAGASGCEQLISRDEDLDIVLAVIEADNKQGAVEEALGIIANVAFSGIHTTLKPTCHEAIVLKIVSFLQTSSNRANSEQSHELCYAIATALAKTPQAPLHGQERELLRLAVASAQAFQSGPTARSAGVVAQACVLLRVLLCTASNREEFHLDGNNTRILVRCVDHLSGRPLHVVHALLALGNATFDSAAAKSAAQDAHAIERAHRALEGHMNVAGVAEAALRALHAVCMGSGRGALRAVRDGVCVTCVRVADCWPGNAVLQERALAVVLCLREAGGPELLREALGAAKRATGAFPFSKTLAAQEGALKAFVEKERETGAVRRLKSLPGAWRVRRGT